MMTSDVETSQAFNYALSPHERCIRGDNNNNKKTKNNNNSNTNNNVRNIHVAFEKNLNVFVRDHLENVTVSSGENVDESTKAVPECSSSKSSVPKTEEPRLSATSSIGSDPDPGQPDKNASRKETMPASSLVQIWEARTTQQPPNQIDSRTSSSESNVLESSESLNEEPTKESEAIQPIQEGNNEDEREEGIESDSQSVSGEKEREGIRVMDIIRKLSSDTETTTGNNDNGSSTNDNIKEVQTTTITTTETRSFPQVSCSPRIRGRQAFADLLVRMMRDREKELVCLLDRHCVSKFTHRGRIQSTLRIRCYERCIAIQDKYRSKSRAAGSDLNRSPRGSGVMHLLKEKNKTNSGNIETAAQSTLVSCRGRVMDKDPQKSLEKKVVEETMDKIDVKEVQEVISAVETGKKAVLSELVENKSGLKKSTGETIKKEIAERRGSKRETMAQEAVETAKKAVLSELVENKNGLKKSSGETIKQENAEKGGEKRETMEKPVAREGLEGRGEKETAKKAVLSRSGEDKSGLKKPIGETIQKETTEGRGDKTESKEKAIANENMQGNALVGLAEKVNRWNSEEKINRSRWTEKGKTDTKANTERVDKNDVLEEATRRTINVPRGERRKEKEDCVSVETKSRDIGHPQQVNNAPEEEKVVKETTTRNNENGLKKPTEKENKEGREMEESVEGNTFMGIAEKVKMWNSKYKKSRRRYSMDRGRGRAKNWERSITTSKVTVEKVVGTQEMKDKRESGREIMCEPEEKELCSGEAKSKDVIEVKVMSSQEVIIPAQESACHGSPERGKEISPSPQGEEIIMLQNPDANSTRETDGNHFQENIIEEVSGEKAKEKNASQHDEEVKEVAIEFANDWDENEVEEEEEDDYEDYEDYGELSTDWIYDVSRPRSYWEELRKERYLEVLNTESDKKDICNLIQSRTVSNFLTSDLRQKIDNLMTSLVQNHLSVPINQDEDDDEEEEEETWVEECSARNQEDNETEEKTEKTNLEASSDTILEAPSDTILEADLDACSQSSERSSTLMISWSFRDQDIDKDHQPTTSLSLPEPSSATSQTTQEMQMISELREQMEQLQREMLELRNTVKSCTDMQRHFQKSATQDSCLSGSSAEQRVETKNPLKRKCCVCSEMPVDSLLYRCGHMCTCLKCAHELQWSSKKCPICMAPIVDVVRAFLDA